MRKVLISIAAAASALAVATPAAAHYYPVRPASGYGSGYGLSHARAMKARVDRIQFEIRRLAQYRMISPREYRNLIRDSREVEYRLIRNARDGRGLSPREAYETERRIARLERRIARDRRPTKRRRTGAPVKIRSAFSF